MGLIAGKKTETGYEIATDNNEIKQFQGMDMASLEDNDESELLLHYARTNDRPFDADDAYTETSILLYLLGFAQWKNKQVGSKKITGSYLIGIGKQLFHVNGLVVEEVKSCITLGKGYKYCLTALYLGQGAKDAINTSIALRDGDDTDVQELIR